jgi:molybdate transport system regulatory protein
MLAGGIAVGGSFMQRNIVVSSSGRKLGKTLLICSLTRLLTASGCTVSCVKLSRGTHGEPGLHEGPGRAGSDTDRYTVAGASRACMYRFEDPSELPGILDRLAGESDLVVWESGTVLRFIRPDFHVHIKGSEEPPETGELPDMMEPDVGARGPLDPESARRLAAMIPGMLGMPSPSPFTVEGKHWLSLDDRPLFGEGRIGLLRAIRETGSILSASTITGIPYRRAWALVRESEETLGADLVHSGRGGIGGGGSRLTRFGEWLLEVWERSEKNFRDLLDRLEAR